ncbi:STE3-domain-containing protein [Peniophora sp. CONT]|nr:STE3-domain-containing protein [Peniophora sp. CONT]
MDAVDPTYPLYPIASTLASVMLLLVLLTSFVRQNWNLGVTFLCFWLFLLNLTNAVNAIIWSDNTDLKHFVYCDIVSHLQVAANAVIPMATLIITRRLYLIVSLRSVDLPNKASRRRNSIVEWTLGLFIPLLVAGPIYYVHQGNRFQVIGVFGCINEIQTSILELLTMESWTVIPPLVSIAFFYPKVVQTFRRQSRDIHSFINRNASVSRMNYLRILILASIDLLLTLPVNMINITLRIMSLRTGHTPLVFYPGWTVLHTDWAPVSIPYTQEQTFGTPYTARSFFLQWSNSLLAFVIFGLFGLTSEARASYLRIICAIGGWIGRSSASRAQQEQASLGEIEFGTRPQEMSLGDAETGPGSCHPVSVTPEPPAARQETEHLMGESGVGEKLESQPMLIEEVRRSLGDTGTGERRVSVGSETIDAAV